MIAFNEQHRFALKTRKTRPEPIKTSHSTKSLKGLTDGVGFFVSIFFNMAASANLRIWNFVLAVGSATTICIPVGSACTSEYVEAAAPVILIE